MSETHDIGPGLSATSAQRRARKVYERIQSKKVTSPLQLTKDWVRKQLAEGPVPSLTLNKNAVAAGYTKGAVAKARQDLGCLNERIGTIWYCRMPKHEPVAAVKHESFNDLDRNFEACEDQFNVSQEERVRLKIAPNEQVCWERSPEVWGKVAGAGNLSAWKQNNPGARVILDNGAYVYNGEDAVLCVVPRSEVEKRLKLQKEGGSHKGEVFPGCDAIEKEFANEQAGQKMADDFNRENAEQMQAIMRANHVTKQMQNSPSSGWRDIEGYVRANGLSEMDILRSETCAALPGLTNQILNMSDKELQSLFDTEPERGGRAGQPRGDGGKFLSVAQNVRPRNLMSDDARRQQQARVNQLSI